MDLMIIAAFDIYQYSLELNQPLILSGNEFKTRKGLIVHLKSGDGSEGFGEIAPLPGFSQETLSEAKEQAQILQANLLDQEISEKLSKLDGSFDKWLGDAILKPSVRFGLEGAILNLIASKKKTSLQKLISKNTHTQIRVNGLLAGSNDQVTIQAQDLITAGFKELKLKVDKDVDDAIKKVKAVNEIVYGKALLHVDANQAWSYEEAVEFGKQIGCDAVNYIEEPFKDIRKIPEFFDETLIPVALDESVQRLPFEDVKSISGVDILVLKPTLLGGIEKTWQVINRAENLALDAVISSSFESSLGILTLANLAGTLSHGGIAAGLDTLKWFKTDVLSSPLRFEKGGIDLTDTTVKSEDINFEALTKI